MDRQAWFVLVSVMTPLVVIGLIVLGRRSTPRALVLLSAASLILAGAVWAVFAVEYARGAYALDGYFRDALGSYLTVLEIAREAVLNLAYLAGIIAWALALFHTTYSKRWGWFAGICTIAVLSYVAASIELSPAFMRQNVVFDQLMSTHFLAISIILGVLAHLSAFVTLLYALLSAGARTAQDNP